MKRPLRLDGFIDQALLNNMAQVDIIPRDGTGATVKGGTTSTPAATNMSKDFEYAPQNAGGKWPQPLLATKG